MKSVLLVDDERHFLSSLKQGLLSSGKRCRVLTAHNGREAIEILGRGDVDLVVTDLNMPEVDGMALLAHMTQHHPRVPAVVMTAYGSPETEEKVAALGAVRYVEKPIDFDEMAETVFEMLALPTSYVSGIALTSFVQLIHIERKTCVVKATTRNGARRSGLLYFRDGELVDATHVRPDGTEMDGLDAAFEVLAWSDTSIEIDERWPDGVAARIELPLANVLMQSVVINDERAAGQDGGEGGEGAATRPVAVEDVAQAPRRKGGRKSAAARAAEAAAKQVTDVIAGLRAAVPEIEAAGLVNANGLVSNVSFGPDAARQGLDEDRIGSMLAGLLGFAETSSSRLARGEFRRVCVEAGGGYVVALRVVEEQYLFVVSGGAAKLGLVFGIMDNAARRVRDAR